MTSYQQKNLIDKAINCLRMKKTQKLDPKCTLKEIFDKMTSDERQENQIFEHHDFLNQFYEAVKVM